MRGLNDKFIKDLTDGCLSFFLNKVKSNSNLCLEIRNGYINIYYRGGNLLKITQKKNGYQFFFDAKYCLSKNDDTNFELLNSLNTNDIKDYINNFQLILAEMDSWLAFHPKAEREFQHNLLKSNSCIIDIEYQIKRRLRLDMIVFANNKLIIVENKFGGGAVSGRAGIAKHYKDILNILLNSELKDELIQSAVNISRAKYKLGLTDMAIKEEDIKGFDILFLFADYNKESKVINSEIKLMDRTFPAKILFMDKNDCIMNYNNAKDLFSYGD